MATLSAWLSVLVKCGLARKSLKCKQLSNACGKIYLELDVTGVSVEKVQIASNNCR